MCYALYIGSDAPLPVDFDSEWLGRFQLRALEDGDHAVLDKFSKRHVAYAASWQDCGCGWFPPVTLFRGRLRQGPRLDKTRQCLRELVEVLARALEQAESAELFLCWEGQQANQPARRIELGLADFEGDALPMQELDFAVVRRGPTHLTSGSS